MFMYYHGPLSKQKQLNVNSLDSAMCLILFYESLSVYEELCITRGRVQEFVIFLVILMTI